MCFSRNKPENIHKTVKNDKNPLIHLHVSSSPGQHDSRYCNASDSALVHKGHSS